MNIAVDTRPLSFGTKADTLARLSTYPLSAKFCDQVVVASSDWVASPAKLVSEVAKRFGDHALAVRSSSLDEDGATRSLAGVHLSLTDVPSVPRDIEAAIEAVFASYTRTAADNQVLIQPMVESVAISGVALTRDLDSGGPYYVINYDDFSGQTDTVTGGRKSTTLLVHRSRTDAVRSSRFSKLLVVIQEIEAIAGGVELDLEFCITKDQDVFVLQVRPLTTPAKWNRLPDATIDAALAEIRTAIDRRQSEPSNVLGSTTILGEMADWNPAEIIGTAPRPLALSLYKYLITDQIWSTARSEMGYRSVDQPLLVDYCGHPYIDVRLSLNSLLPFDLEPEIGHRIIDAELTQLAENPALHDKIEFDIAITCRDFSFEVGARRLKDSGVSTSDIEALSDGLGVLTKRLLSAGVSQLDAEMQNTEILAANVERPDQAGLATHCRNLLERTREFGTLPFAKLARHGFLGILFLRSLVHREVFSEDDADRFMRGIHTITAEFIADIRNLASGAMERHALLRKYGHLRPGTYDILSWRYDERPEMYISDAPPPIVPLESPFVVSNGQKSDISKLLNEFGYPIEPDELLAYISRSIKARESSKFVFTKAISNALSALTEWGDRRGLSHDDLSFLPIQSIKENSDVGRLKEHIDLGREKFRITQAIRLPHLIVEPSDIDVVRMPIWQPNYISGKSVTGPVRAIKPDGGADIDGCIVMIESADPGFDWIFSHNISGLITKYGGANSHMAIRCAEFGLPAAIGCGDRLFEILSRSSIIELNCAARTIKPAGAQR